ncbi:hypothetical protein Vretimale_5861 [Volvox reticuliferus]|uniref:Uncharacterized protein n=1 Tax=Volvox reticuliferus TaxID=1737510 RepID=A0A8J4LLJ4_9CHLO|nr:hypothetical protein Vretifemale_5885 [Volvox reticuliferus]GIM00986.1 hypothetical protein Vretimale_5861 [Volvox reticuliferus]
MPSAGIVTRQRYKVVVLGAPAAGKTALVRRLADGYFLEGARQRGLDFYSCHITLRDDVTVVLQLWDLSDCPCRPEDDHSPLSAYIFNSQAVLFVYDVSCPSSLEALCYALRAVGAACIANGGTQPYLALIANKCDLQWTASEALAHELAARHGCVRYALSARSGQGVKRAAVQLACDLAGVPVASATEHSILLLEPDGMVLPPDFTAGVEQPPSGTGPAAADASDTRPLSASSGSPPLGSVTVPAAAAAAALQRQVTAGKFHARAPVYQAVVQTLPAASSNGSLNELKMYGIGGGSQSRRSISHSTTPSRTTTIISKTLSLGQRVHSGSSTLSPTLEGQGVSGAGQGATAPSEETAAPGGVSECRGLISKSFQEGPRRGWRTMLCCLGPSAVVQHSPAVDGP